MRQISQVKRRSDIFIENNNVFKIVPTKKILVGDETYLSDEIFVKPIIATHSEIIINWKIISKDYKTDGILKVKFDPEIVLKHTTILVDDPLKVGAKEGDVEEVHEAAK